MKETTGSLDGKGKRFAIVASRFNSVVTDELVAGALEALTTHGVSLDDIELFRVPGAFELAPACARLIERGETDGIVALGCVIRGDTPHFDYIAGEVARGIGSLALQASVAIAFGVLTTDTLEQALRRAGNQADNKGWDAGLVALEMANLYRTLQ